MLQRQPQPHTEAYRLKPKNFQLNAYPGKGPQFKPSEKSSSTDIMERTPGDHHVLIVHYRRRTLKMMASIFQKLGYQVATAFDSAKALLYFGRKPCNLLFTDLDMPVLNGYHLARLIKEHRPQVKAVAMTCRCQAELVDLMGDGIIDGWMFKPFKLKALSDTLADIGAGPVNSVPQGKK